MRKVNHSLEYFLPPVFLLLPDIVSVGTSCRARWGTVANFPSLDELFLS